MSECVLGEVILPGHPGDSMPAFLPEEAARFQTKGFLWEIPHVPHFAGQPAFSAWQESAAGLRSFPGFPGYPAFDFWRRVLCILFRRHFENDVIFEVSSKQNT